LDRLEDAVVLSKAERDALDNKLSQRFIHLDPAGYFIIYIDHEQQRIWMKHYPNAINEKGLAVDPQTGEPIPTKGKVLREPDVVLSGRTAKELCIELFEKERKFVTMFDHAAYLGRELMRAQFCLDAGIDYIQD
jgi:dihydropteroate synthase